MIEVAFVIEITGRDTYYPYDLPIAPNIGEMVIIEGKKYIVVKRIWVIGEDKNLTCIVRLSKEEDD